MALFPTNFFENIAQGADTSAIRSYVSAFRDATNSAVLDLINGLSAGDTILGKVVSQTDDSVRITTKDGITFTAAKQDRIALTKGQSVLFEVFRNNDSKIALRPLYSNMNQQNTAVIALRQAGIPVDDRALEMTARNMEYGNPIDRDSLSASYKDVSLNPDFPVRHIVDLQKLGIEVTSQNLRQYESYLSMEGVISDSMIGIASDMGDAITNELINEFTKALSFDTIIDENIDWTQDTINQDANNTNVQDDMSQSVTGFQKPEFACAKAIIDWVQSIDSQNASLDSGFVKGDVMNLSNMLRSINQESPALNELISDTKIYYEPKDVLRALLQDITSADISRLTPTVSYADDSGNVTIDRPLDSLLNFLNQDVIKNVVSKTISSQWELSRNKISDKGEVTELFSRLYNQTDNLLNQLKQANVPNENLMSAVNNLHENVDFMNALNQYIPYVQIPFKGENGSKNAELFVYTRKHNSGEGQGDLSAFIHLDCENIGPCDIYVKLAEGSRISTKFTFRDDEVLNLVANNIGFLEKRIREKGYTISCEFTKGEEPKSALSKVIQQTTQHLKLGHTSFDARV